MTVRVKVCCTSVKSSVCGRVHVCIHQYNMSYSPLMSKTQTCKKQREEYVHKSAWTLLARFSYRQQWLPGMTWGLKYIAQCSSQSFRAMWHQLFFCVFLWCGLKNNSYYCLTSDPALLIWARSLEPVNTSGAPWNAWPVVMPFYYNGRCSFMYFKAKVAQCTQAICFIEGLILNDPMLHRMVNIMWFALRKG